MSDELDDELQGLLNELDEREEDLVENTIAPEPEIEKPESIATEEIVDPLDELEDINEDDGDFALRPSDIRRMGPDEIAATNTTEQEIEIIVPQLDVDYQKYKDQLDVVTQEVLQACRADRQEAQDVINDLKDRMTTLGGGAPPKALVDGLVKAVEVKASINQNAIRMMDTNARFLASIKSSINTTNNNNLNVSSAEELKRILEGG